MGVIETSRRSFLFGLGAVAASIAVLPSITSATLIIPPPITFRRREVHEIMAWCEVSDDRQGWIEYQICRSNGEAIFQTALNRHSTMRWVAVPGSEIICTKDNGLIVSLSPENDLGGLMMSGYQFDDNEHKTMFWEKYTWPGPSTEFTKSEIPTFSDDDGSDRDVEYDDDWNEDD